ncbi:hypothetical protein BGZ46_007773 [Entomortierella lignicola]|nr:hypothetical protein BGZ46_007773 [Entomortierella lignicola]
MDNVGFQGMPRFPLTPAEEALVPRPHASASQVATTLPSAYSRSRTSLSSSPPSQSHLQQRPQYSRKNEQNHPYSKNQGSPRIFPFSFSNSSITNRNQQSSPPSSPTTPSQNNTNFNSNPETDEQEYPQNPQNSLFDYHPQIHSPVPVRPASPEQLPRKSFSLNPRAARPPSPQLYSDLYENTSYQHQYPSQYPHRGSLDSHPRLTSPLQLTQGYQESWGSRVESPVPISDSESSQSDTKEMNHNNEPRQFMGRFYRSSNSAQESVNDATSQRRASLESEHATRFSHDSQREVLAKLNRSGQDISDEERQESRKSRPTWRPSLSLIRQEVSTFNVLTMQDQRRYPQNDQRRISDTPGMNEPRKQNGSNGRTKKKGKRARRRRNQQSHTEYHSKGNKALPTLAEVLDKKSRYPLGYNDFEAFLRSQRAVEYLNFWADVTAHEQLCKTFNISERRLKREHQLGERALARERRRFTRPSENELANNLQEIKGSTQETNRTRTSEQGSNAYQTNRSNLQLPLHDHLPFHQEPRRYGIQDSPTSNTPISHLISQRRGSEQRTGVRKSSLEGSRQSLDEILLDQDTTLTDTNHMINQLQELASVEGLRVQGRRPSIAVEYHGNGIKSSSSQPSLSPQRHDQNTYGEIAQFVEVVEGLIPPGQMNQYIESPAANRMSQQSLKIVEPIIHRKQSVVRADGIVGSFQPSSLPRRSGESAFVPSPYSTVHDGRPLLAQSYRTISLEDLEESALRIYRKYLIQLRTSSMAKEEEASAAAAAAATMTSASNVEVSQGATINSTRGGQILAPGWGGYAEQVIAEWNSKWRGRNDEARKARRISNRRDAIGIGSHSTGKKNTSEKEASQSTADATEVGANGARTEEKASLSDDDEDITVEGSVPDHSTKSRTKAPRRPKLDRNETATGITAFLARLLRTETTVLELPTLTINTTTVVTDAESDGSEYDDDYDDDDEDLDAEDIEDDEELGTEDNSQRLEALMTSLLQNTGHTEDKIENSARDPTPSGTVETGRDGSAIQIHQLVSRQLTNEQSTPENQIQLQHSSANDNTLQTTSEPILPVSSPEAVAKSAAAAAFYLPLECRERIHAQIQQEKRTTGGHVFGPAKGFVVDVVLRDYYFPLFLKQVKNQNMGLLPRSHINNRIKQGGMIAIGIALWVMVIAIQVTLVLMAWGGWSRPWVWVVGIVGGWPGTICLATGITGFSPLLGLVHKM